MLVFYTTFHLSHRKYEEGLAYLRTVYIPAATRSGQLRSPRLQRVVHEVEGAEGVSLSVQFGVSDEKTLQAWMCDEGAALHQELVARFGHEMAGFSTVLEELELI